MKSKAVLFGASELGKAAFLLLQNKYDIINFYDNDPQKWGEYLNDIKILSPNELKSLSNTEIIITSNYYKEIANQILNLGISYFKIFKFSLENNYSENLTDCNYDREYHGSHYGGYVICPNGINQDSIIYSFGIGTDISFDLSLINKYKVQVNAFDPTPNSIKWLKTQNIIDKYKYYSYGISNSDGLERFFYPKNEEFVSCTVLKNRDFSENYFDAEVFTLKTLMSKFGHEHIDILKLDIEGAEYKVISKIIQDKLTINQILVEFHHRFFDEGIIRIKKVIEELNQAGYDLFYISKNDEVYSFIRSTK